MIDRPEPARPTDPSTLALRRTIVLVGLMGAGKTSVGKRVAAMLSVPFVDADTHIAEAAGMSIPEIFAQFGEAGFRDGERRVIARLLASPPCILATGGGAFIDKGTRTEIAAHATSVWIRAALDLLWDRVRGRPGRPLLDTPNPRAVLADLDARRAPLYALADVTVDSVRGASHEAMAATIIAAVREFDRAHAVATPTLEPV
jgi:shikimate kinase